LDQAYEQNSRIVTDSGGAVGLAKKNCGLEKRWMVSGPAQARLLQEFGDTKNMTKDILSVMIKV